MTHFTRNIVCSLALALSDFISFILSLYLVLWVLPLFLTNFEQRVPVEQIQLWIMLHWLLGFCCISWYGIRLRHYFYRKTFWLELKEVLRTLVIFSIIEMAVIAFSEWYFSRYVWLLTWILSAVLLPLMRWCTKYLLNHFGLWMRDTLIIGNGKNAQEAYNAIVSENNLGLRIKGFVFCNEYEVYTKTIDGIPVIEADKNWLLTVDRHTQFIVALEENQGNLCNEWLREFMIKGYRYVSVIPSLRGMPLNSTDVAFIFSHEVMIFRVQQNLAKISSRIMKRIFDIVCSIIILIILSPLLFYVANQVRKDGGNIIYGHKRVGKGGKLFKCLKFRSMIVNSEEVLDQFLEANPDARNEWNATFKLKNDPRITRIGHFLRRTSLDELPQLFNVLKGDMSLVGPRPIITEELERYSDEVDYYLLSKPGMTGLWQVSGRSDISYETRVYLDAWYVKNWSMWNDIAILFKTVSVVLSKDGAY